ncbi:MAG: sodium:glutamate symporter, partial [Planctomycetota bacterium]|nr:sodium:glutamate symporter [Planctomycetota bacterium]
MEIAFLFTCGLLLIGLFLRARVTLLQRIYVPASIIGGLIGLLAVQGIQATSGLGQTWIAEQATGIVDQLRTWPGWLIAVVFAGLFLDKPGKSLLASLRGAAR